MQIQDLFNAISEAERVAQHLGKNHIYSTNLATSFGLYLNATNKFISIHEPNSTHWKKAQQSQPSSKTPAGGFVFSQTKNGFWLGGFNDPLIAIGFAELVRKFAYLITREEVCLSSSGLNSLPQILKPF